MPRKPGLLNVKALLAHVVRSCEDMIARDGKFVNGLRLAPIDRDNLIEIRLLANALLRKAAVDNNRTKQRRDVRIGV